MLLLSIHPRFADAILAGTKTVELRRRVPRVAKGDQVLVYSTMPVAAVIGLFTVEQVVESQLEPLWRRTRTIAAVTRDEFNSYFVGLEMGVGIWVGSVKSFRTPIPLWTLRQLWPGFHPPQGFRYLKPHEITALLNETSTCVSRSRAA